MSRRKDSESGLPRPFLKWAGGKTQVLPALEPLLPALEAGATYHEPFVGGGAVYFHLAVTGRLPGRAVLSDTNADLVTAFTCVREAPELLAARLAQLALAHSEETYYRERDTFNTMILAPLERTALMIYLNKAGFNGLWRVNASGHFNVPCGRQASGPGFPHEEHLAACARALAPATIACEPFDAVLSRAHAGDLVYFDPPYVPVSKTAFFTAYTEEGFGPADQLRLRDAFAELTKRGCHVLLSNSDTPEVRALYADFDITGISARRSINSRATARGPVGEVIVRGGPASPRGR